MVESLGRHHVSLDESAEALPLKGYNHLNPGHPVSMSPGAGAQDNQWVRPDAEAPHLRHDRPSGRRRCACVSTRYNRPDDGFVEDPLRGLLRGEGGRVEPPSEVPETVHGGAQLLVAVEEELLLG